MRCLIHCAVALSLPVFAGEARPQGAEDPYAAHVSRADPRTPEDERKGFHLPPGFDIQLVAAEPFVRKPINMNFDARGRLYVTESVEYPFGAAPGKPPRDTVRILGRFDRNGLAQEVTTFADGLNIPIGVLPIRRGAIVYSIPTIQRLDDTDGDDRADRRGVLYGTFGHKDTHGMTGEFTRGFDGWIYACHGFANTSEVVGSDGHSITMQSGSTYRFKPDGSHVEYFTHGQVNPFGLCFDPLGNLYSCDCHSRPIYMLLRGAYYPSFGKPHDGLDFGPEMLSHDHGSTAIAGITYYAADHFPPAYRDTIFIGNVVTNRINHDRLERHGSTLLGIQQPDFLTSDDPWFRPVDIKLGPDGALYVADFYNRIIGHYEVPLTHPGRDRSRGRIWRIVYRGSDGGGSPRQPRPDSNKATVEELVHDLAHANLTVRMQAAEQLVERGGQPGIEAILQLLHGPSNPFQRMHGLWVLERQGALDDRALESAAADREPGVRVHAMRVLVERPRLSTRLHAILVAGLNDSDAFVQRAAAEALGTHPEPANIRPLLDLRHRVPLDDTHLLHMVRMALRDQLRTPAAWQHLASPHGAGFQPVSPPLPPPTGQKGRQMASSPLPPLAGGKGRVRGEWTERDTRAIADVATGVPSPEAAEFLLGHLEHFAEPQFNQLRYVYHIARYGQPDTAARLLTFARGDRAAPIKHHVELLKAIVQGNEASGSRPTKDVTAWGEDLMRQLLAPNDENDLLLAMELGGLLKLAQTHVAALAADKRAPQAVRESALAVLVSTEPAKRIPLLAQILSDATEPVAMRLKAAQLLAAMNRAQAQAELLKSLVTAPQQLAVTIAAGLATTPRGAQKLLDAVDAGKASAQLVQERQVAMRLDQTQAPELRDRVAKLSRGLPSPDKRVQELLTSRRSRFRASKTDPALGAKVFEKHCAICHQIANRGAKIGPQLDGVGIRGVDRLLEDILDPSRNVDQAFRLTTLGLKSGQIVSGLLLREEGQVLVLADNQGKEVRIPKSEIEDRTLSQLSPMPANLADQIPDPDFNHLLAFLLAQQPPKPEATRPLGH
jgi:putative heme-binding domain-containing protein